MSKAEQERFNFNMGYASALLMMYFMLVMGTSMLFIRLRRAASEAM